MQRAGLPIYPPELCERILNGNQGSQNIGFLTVEASQHDNLSQTDKFDIPDVDFKTVKFHHGPSQVPAIFDMPENLFEQSSDSSHLFPTLYPSKRLRGSEVLYNSFGSCTSNALPRFDQYYDQYGNYTGEKIYDHPRFYPPFDPVSNTSNQFHGDNMNGSHAMLNGNVSSSVPLFGARKLELPSLQYTETQRGSSWVTHGSPLPSLESVDTLIQSPPVESIPSDLISPQSSGLLEAIVYNSNSTKDSNTDLFLPVITGTSNEAAGSSTLNHPYKTEWDEQGESNSPLGQSAASVMTDYTAISSVDGPQSIETTQGNTIRFFFFFFISEGNTIRYHTI